MLGWNALDGLWPDLEYEMIRFLGNLKMYTWLAVVAGIASLERVLMYLLYRPVSYNDTVTYRRLAEAVLNNWNLDGTRMPGYPVFLALIGADEHVYAAQLLLGLATTLLLFYVGCRVSGKSWFGALAALAHTLNLQQLFTEADLLTETLTTFFLVLTVAGMAWILFSDRKRPAWQTLFAGLVIGICAGLAALVRTIFVFLPFWGAFLLVGMGRMSRRERWGAVTAAILGGSICLGIWVNFIHRNYHMWSLSTVDGYHLMNHTGVFFEYVPDRYAALRDTFLEYRKAQVAQTGSSGNTIWSAIPAMEKVSGLGFYDLSRLLEKISIQLILQHPVLYLRNVIQGWIGFWKVPLHWPINPQQPPFQTVVQRSIIVLDRGTLFLANLGFLGGSVLLLWKKARPVLKTDRFWIFLVGLIWLTSIGQALLEYGDNPRYSVPIQTLLLLTTLWWGRQVITRLSKPKV